MEDKTNWNTLFLCWLVSAIATGGSLFFSQVMEFAPCSLCWYQRILMYPLAVLFLIALFPLDLKVIRYTLPLSLIGFAIAFYHNLVQWEIVPETMTPCMEGVSCAAKWIEWFGFITIPFLSLIAFSIIIFIQLYLRRRN